jgi:hypothetical protein
LSNKTVYQTLDDLGNPDEIENHGPYRCDRKNAWLGVGFYFWESFIQNAHWWGNSNYKVNGYIICEAIYTKDENKCFNLIDDEIHIKMFNDAKSLMLKEGLYVQNVTTVARVIHYLRTTLKIFTYEAIRVYGVNSKSINSDYSNISIFNSYHIQQYLDTNPAIQICFYRNNSLDLRNYKVIYPAYYNDDYLV